MYRLQHMEKDDPIDDDPIEFNCIEDEDDGFIDFDHIEDKDDDSIDFIRIEDEDDDRFYYTTLKMKMIIVSIAPH
ncbi:glutamic acid-rich protein-like [Cucumis melo var. makuwa]|uniref:Glutamic acid-rich protein-like n=1 Tax=Cucumis melo var. makuwa TaxID=1194695 RepID=A0A5D3DSJ5_CUCMM|nr:glutamic acid-rich protein-like [Cucumis melo var. makuwa]